MNNGKKEPWRIIVGIVSVAYIIFLWIKKDIADIYATMPAEQVVPLVATTVAVPFLKVAVLAGVILLLKWILGKIKKKND